MDLAIFHDNLSAVGSLPRPELHCDPPLHGFPQPYISISACDVDKLSDMGGNSASCALWSG